MKRTEQPSRRTKVFNYTKFQWAEIEASIAAVRDAPLTEKERELLLGAARAYFSPPAPHSIQARKWSALATLYTAYFRTRKSEGLITRKLSVTESRRASQFRGTSRVRKVIVFVLKSRNVA